jgi:hypothetical protein
MGLHSIDKETVRWRAQQLFPTVALQRPQHQGKAAALLLAEYLRREGGPRHVS